MTYLERLHQLDESFWHDPISDTYFSLNATVIKLKDGNFLILDKLTNNLLTVSEVELFKLIKGDNNGKI